MAAGSVIARDGGRAEPRQDGRLQARDAVHVRAAWRSAASSLSGVPPFAGFFSKDEILAQLIARGGWHIVLAVLGYVGAFMTAIYTWRMIFRAFYGAAGRAGARARGRPPLPRARAHEPGDGRGRGHRRRLPRPGPPHRRARVDHEGRDGRARASARSSAACCRSRTLDARSSTTSSSRRSHDSPYYDELEPSDGATSGAAGRRRGARARRHLRSPTSSGCATAERTPRDRAARALRRALHAFFVTSGTSTS